MSKVKLKPNAISDRVESLLRQYLSYEITTKEVVEKIAAVINCDAHAVLNHVNSLLGRHCSLKETLDGILSLQDFHFGIKDDYDYVLRAIAPDGRILHTAYGIFDKSGVFGLGTAMPVLLEAMKDIPEWVSEYNVVRIEYRVAGKNHLVTFENLND